MSVIDELIGNASSYSESFDRGDLPLPPAKRVAIVACMDARLNPYGLLGLHEGDAHVIRNAGGVITDDEIRSLSISQRLLGTEEIMLITTPIAGCSPSKTTTFAVRSSRRRVSSPSGPRRLSTIWKRTSVSRSHGSRQAPSSRTRTVSAASCTR